MLFPLLFQGFVGQLLEQKLCPKNQLGPCNGRGLNLYDAGMFGEVLKISSFEGSGYLGWPHFSVDFGPLQKSQKMTTQVAPLNSQGSQVMKVDHLDLLAERNWS